MIERGFELIAGGLLLGCAVSLFLLPIFLVISFVFGQGKSDAKRHGVYDEPEGEN